MKVAVIGAGNMGLAFSQSFVSNNLISVSDLLLIEKNEDRAQFLKDSNFGTVSTQWIPEISEANILILAVKPQDFFAVASELKNFVSAEQVVLSIMAGIKIESIQEALGLSKVVRAMPNTPSMIGLGITGYFASADVSDSNKKLVENLLNTTGKSILVANESDLEVVTALSGSGPAYFYYFTKHMVEVGKTLGFDSHASLNLVKETMLGAYHLIDRSEGDMDKLISIVASKGGSTQAAINTFEENGVGEGIQKGLLACHKRAQELAAG
ncbi:MAG: pyrroline-5-carboxylate reductase [Leadbetterella sp.]